MDGPRKERSPRDMKGIIKNMILKIIKSQKVVQTEYLLSYLALETTYSKRLIKEILDDLIIVGQVNDTDGALSDPDGKKK